MTQRSDNPAPATTHRSGKTVPATTHRSDNPVPVMTHSLRLSPEQQEKIKELVKDCQTHDGISLSYPLDEAEGNVLHYQLTGSHGQLLAVLGVILPEEPETAETNEGETEPPVLECIAFTAPTHRRKGCFSRLLDAATEDFDETDFLFPVDERCPDTVAALEAIGAELDHREYRMEQLLTGCTEPALLKEQPVRLISTQEGQTRSAQAQGHTQLLATQEGQARLAPAQGEPNFNQAQGENTVLWTLLPAPLRPKDAAALCHAASIGSCLTTRVALDCVCLHQVEILPDWRVKGYGKILMELLLARLCEAGVRRVILQVSGDNAPALALYKKTGFRVTETLSYYLY